MYYPYSVLHAPVLGRVSGDKSILPLSIIWTKKKRKEKIILQSSDTAQLATGGIMHNIMPLSGPGHKSCYKSCHSLSHTVSQQVNEPPTLQTLVVQSLIYKAKSLLSCAETRKSIMTRLKHRTSRLSPFVSSHQILKIV